MNASPNLSVDLEQHGSFLRDLARSLVGDPGLADDLSQDAWMARVRSVERGGAPTDPTETRRWLSTVLRRGASNVRRSGVRRAAREAVVARPEAVTDLADAASRMEIAATLLRLVRQLDEPARTAIIARFYEGLTYEEIGAREGCPPSTARSRVGRGLEDLRQQLDREPSGGRAAWLTAVSGLAVPPKSASSAGTASLTTAAGWIAAALVVVTTGAGAALWHSLEEPRAARQARGDSTMAVTSPDAESTQAPSLALAGVPHLEPTVQEGRTAIEVTPVEPPLSGDGVVWQLLESGKKAPSPGAIVTWSTVDTPTLSSRIDALRNGEGRLDDLGYGGAPDASVSATCREDGTYDWPEDRDPSTSDAPLVIEVPGDDVYSAVRWEGTASEWSALEKPIEMVRLPLGTFTGRVVDLKGRPMEGVKVTGDRGSGPPRPAVLSDGEGCFSIPSLGRSGSILAERAGWVMCSEDSVSKLARKDHQVPELVIARAGTLRIEMGDAEHTPKMAAALVSYSESRRRFYFANSKNFEQARGEDGSVVVEGLPVGQRLVVLTGHERAYSHMMGGRLVLEPKSDGAALPQGAVPIVIPEGGRLNVRLEDSRYWSIHGVVLDVEGLPVPNTSVLLGMYWPTALGGSSTFDFASTDESGSFQFRPLVTGELQPYLLQVAPPQGAIELEAVFPEQVRSGQPLEIVLGSPTRVQGVVRVSEGEASGTRVYATLLDPTSSNPQHLPMELTQTRPEVGPDGTFTFMGLPGRRYRILALHPQFAPEVLTWATDSGEPLAIRLDRPGTTKVKLALDFGDAGGAAPPYLSVASFPEVAEPDDVDPGLLRTRHGVELRDGSVEFQLAPGSHTLEVSSMTRDGQRLVTLPMKGLVVGEEPMELRVALVPSLDGRQRIELTPGERRRDLWLTVHRPGSPEPVALGRTPFGLPTRFVQLDGHGAFRFCGPAGTYDVRVGTRRELMEGKGRLIPRVSLQD
ncbi:sigma-70 family RNA polymerase sigma factor [Saltatorellus ferox]